jgi:hypothetical protein
MGVVLRLKLLLLYCLTFIYAYPQRVEDITFKEITVDTLMDKPDNILILGIGSTHSRIFLDGISSRLTSSFSKSKVLSKFFYLGADLNSARVEFDTIDKEGFNAILLFLPKGASYYDLERISSTSTQRDPVTGATYTREIRRTAVVYEQSFEVQLISIRSAKRIVWSGLLDVTGELTRKKFYIKSAREIIESLRLNAFIK